MKIKIGKMKATIPDEYQRLKPLPDDLPEQISFGGQTENALALVRAYPVAMERAMPFNSPQTVINWIHDALSEDQGLIEVSAGKTKGGKPYIFSIVKTRQQPSGMQYVLTLHMRFPSDILEIQAFFEEYGMTGLRDTIVHEIERREGNVGDGFEGWMRDPYDPEYTKGIRMNLSEFPKYDKMFPNHPLSVLRRFVEDVRENN